MFKRHDGKSHQNPPRVFGPGSDLRERVEHQDIIIEELMNIVATHLPKEGKAAAEELKERYEDSRRALHRHQAMKILDGQGEHASLEHYIHRFTTPDPQGNTPYPFPNPKTSVYDVLSGLISKHVVKSHRELQLRGAGRRKLGPDTSIVNCESDIYTDTDGSLVLVLAGEEAVGKWCVRPFVSLLQHAPAQTFFKRSHLEELITELFTLLSTKYGVEFSGDEPLSSSHLAHELEKHLPRQFLVGADTTHLQPSEFQKLALSPLKGIEYEYDELKDGHPTLRVRHDPHTHSVDHLFQFPVGNEGYISYSANEGITFWYYSTTEGLWAGIVDYLPYIPVETFEEAMRKFFDDNGYQPPEKITESKVKILAKDVAETYPLVPSNLQHLKQGAETGHYVVSFDEDSMKRRLLHVKNPRSNAQLLVILDDDVGPPEGVHVVDSATGDCYGWGDLNPHLQQSFLEILQTI